ncbi:hypothetical protein BAUCODRAFT_39065 [Baudoinia panamericana UAMH 10762]|uniref:DUF924-domain-containing protein n=1 Tax=Baudoinia panamericana (strain UAMH 10762) TaxID=717646 RepID=M2MKQ8_BAUPA|nr:uncharacterized protein BAUCODRAFT_39065 [Baudoinia panamericana UAMH 10762]EMC91918.1 hypothetical protein BAUCODRAFT_39065 [Baudoinia panamericana UAMH 10762]
MATSLPTFALDSSLFNQTLYAELHDLWFSGIPDGAESASFPVVQRWFGAGWSDEQKAAFNAKCKEVAGPALESIGPSKITLPPFVSYENEIEHAGTLAAPFLDEVDQAQQHSDKQGADTLLSMILLLDQMPRNIFRKREELPLVYNHYDRLGFALARSSLATRRDLVEHPSLMKRYFWCWRLIPLMHAEHLPSHKFALETDDRWKQMAPEPTEGPAVQFAKGNLEAWDDHEEPLRLFGRYPHRNECLGRQNTPEETEYLKTAKTFGVEQSNKKGDTVPKEEL